MIAAVSFLSVLLVSLIIVRTAAVMLRKTGLSREVARFQARSAFTGTGFTTHESESIINHPVRRRIIQNLMLVGNIGVVSFISSFILTFLSGNSQDEIKRNVFILGGGLLVVFLLSLSRLFDRIIARIVEGLMKRRTRVHLHDYDSLLFLSDQYEIIKTQVKPGRWISDKSLADLQLSDEGVLVIGVRRDDDYYLGAPRGGTFLYPGDDLILYGNAANLQELANRPPGREGDAIHRKQVAAQQKLEGKPLREQKGKGRGLTSFLRRKK